MSDNPFKNISVDEIEQAYREHGITEAERKEALRRKALANIDEKGIFWGPVERAIERFKDNISTARNISRDKAEEAAGERLKNDAWAAFGFVQAALTPFVAVGEISGNFVEDRALKLGLSPTTAKYLGIAVDVGSSATVPMGLAAKGIVKGGQALTKLGKAAKETPDVASEVVRRGEEFLKGGEKIAETAKGATEPVEVASEVVRRGKEFLEASKPRLAETVDEAAEVTRMMLEEAAKGRAPLHTADDFMTSMQKYREELKRITTTKHREQLVEEAKKLGLGLDDLRNVMPGSAMTDAEMLAYLKALEPGVDSLVTLAGKVKAGETAAIPAFKTQIQEFLQYTLKFREAEVTAGRAVKALDDVPHMKRFSELLADWAPEALARGDIPGAIGKLADDVLRMAATRGTEGFKRAGLMKMAREGFINELLFTPHTHVINFSGNVAGLAYSTLERGLASTFGSGKTLGQRFGAQNEGIVQLVAMRAALGDAFRAASKQWQLTRMSGKTPEQAKLAVEEANKLAREAGGLGFNEASKLDFQFSDRALPGLAGDIINIPVRGIVSADRFFKELLHRSDLYVQATREGVVLGKAGEELNSFVSKLVNNPSDRMLKNATSETLKHTYQTELGTVGKAFQSVVEKIPVLSFWFPFIKTPANLVKYAWNRTPGLQFISRELWSDIAAGGSRADAALGRITIANLQGMYFYSLAQEGFITGGGPTNPDLRRQWLTTHQPYSIRTPEGWVSYSRLDPIATPLGIIADYAQISNQSNFDGTNIGEEANEVMTAALVGITRAITNKTYWNSFAEVDKALTGVMYEGEQAATRAGKLLTGPAIAAVTGGPPGATVTRSMDPIMREVRELADNLIAKVPGYSKTLPPRRDVYGDPTIVPQQLGSGMLEEVLGYGAGNWLARVISPFATQARETDPVKLEGARLQIKIPLFPWTIGGGSRNPQQPEEKAAVRLTPEQRDKWIVIYRNLMRDSKHGIESTLLSTPQYRNANDAQQRQMFRTWINHYRNEAQKALLVDDLELRRAVKEAEMSSILPLISEPNREAARRQMEHEMEESDRAARHFRPQTRRWTDKQTSEEHDEAAIRRRAPRAGHKAFTVTGS